ncbi:hypothetical protein MZD04_gp375 [Pseudomonas phage Psa21]|uniref:Uncharacterized protein n=1 Tax=Pseudomonas phage Psa21 TaxID=2530023 RepID=A0A481W4Z2_9CAUD|nr:hypothetical protein MZD04_gp375 [Pseudomonas phage Psa21]QBJ02901.1 hypothetical protein PSA21_375 [Pseudomonas phage Psa21]
MNNYVALKCFLLLVITFFIPDFSRIVFPSSADYFSRGVLSFTILFIMVTAVFTYPAFFAKKYYRKFTLDGVTLVNRELFCSYTERMSVIANGSFEFPMDVKEFWIDLEETSDGEYIQGGTVFELVPKFHLNLHKVSFYDQTDLLKVTIDKDGFVKVEYKTNQPMVEGSAQWEISEVYAK